MDLTTVRNFIIDEVNTDVSLSALLIRFAWHCSGTYDKDEKNGGCNGGTMRFDHERSDPENVGFERAYKLYDTIKEKVPEAKDLTYADLYILGGYVAIEWAGGPRIPFRTGRKDFPVEEATNIYGAKMCPFGKKDGVHNPCGSRLPSADLGVSEENPEADDPCIREKPTIDAVRGTFIRLGFTDRETVALILLGHQFGKGTLENSGYDGFWFPFAPYDWNISRKGPGGGYFSVYQKAHVFKEKRTAKGKRQYETRMFGAKMMMLISDMALFWDDYYKVHLNYYNKSRSAFFTDSVAAWQKLTELGCQGLVAEKREKLDD